MARRKPYMHNRRTRPKAERTKRKVRSARQMSFAPRFPMLPFFLHLSLLPVLLIFVYGSYEFSVGLAILQDTHEWPRTKGKVVTSKVLKRKDYTAERPLEYMPYVTYAYKVGEKTYRSRRIAFGPMDFAPTLKAVFSQNPHKSVSKAKRAREIIKKYPKGSSVAVHFRPEDPGTAVLRTPDPTHIGRFALMVYPVVAIFFAGILAYMFRLPTVLRYYLQNRQPKGSNGP